MSIRHDEGFGGSGFGWTDGPFADFDGPQWARGTRDHNRSRRLHSEEAFGGNAWGGPMGRGVMTDRGLYDRSGYGAYDRFPYERAYGAAFHPAWGRDNSGYGYGYGYGSDFGRFSPYGRDDGRFADDRGFYGRNWNRDREINEFIAREALYNQGVNGFGHVYGVNGYGVNGINHGAFNHGVNGYGVNGINHGAFNHGVNGQGMFGQGMFGHSHHGSFDRFAHDRWIAAQTNGISPGLWQQNAWTSNPALGANASGSQTFTAAQVVQAAQVLGVHPSIALNVLAANPYTAQSFGVHPAAVQQLLVQERLGFSPLSAFTNGVQAFGQFQGTQDRFGFDGRNVTPWNTLGNTFGGVTPWNTLGNSWNTFGGATPWNTFGNTFGGITPWSTLGGQINDVFGLNGFNSAFGGNNVSNAFAANQLLNTFGQNPIAAQLIARTLGQNPWLQGANTFGINPLVNTFGNNPLVNTFGMNNLVNTFGVNPLVNTFGVNAFGGTPITSPIGHTIANPFVSQAALNNTYGAHAVGGFGVNGIHHANTMGIGPFGSHAPYGMQDRFGMADRFGGGGQDRFNAYDRAGFQGGIYDNVSPFWAEQMAFGDERGPHYGRGPKGYKRSDDRIREEVCEVIARIGFVDASDVEITVESGIVRLTGSVAWRRDKRVLEQIAERVHGVEEVRNELRLTRRDSDYERYQSKTASQQVPPNGKNARV